MTKRIAGDQDAETNALRGQGQTTQQRPGLEDGAVQLERRHVVIGEPEAIEPDLLQPHPLLHYFLPGPLRWGLHTDEHLDRHLERLPAWSSHDHCVRTASIAA